MSYTEQASFPLVGTKWNPGDPDLEDYEVPATRGGVVVANKEWGTVSNVQPERTVTVIGTVRNEAAALERSLHWWVQQIQPGDWLVELLVLDDGSSDDPFAVVQACREVFAERCKREQEVQWMRFRYVKLREADTPERSCTLAMNIAFKQLVKTPYVLVQWWDRIPGHKAMLNRLLKPHEYDTGIVTSGISRHIGGSSSMHEMTPDDLAARLDMVDWRKDPRTLDKIAGKIGGHCIPGNATESSCWCTLLDEVVALGGYDERYRARAGYANVELWRRMLQAGLVAKFAVEPYGANFHQSHAANRVKDDGCLADLHVRRNHHIPWGVGEVLEER